MTTWKIIGLIALLVPALAHADPVKLKAMDRKVTVRLSFSTEEYDPSKPSKATMKCVVQNNSPSPVHVPVGFDGGYIRIQSGLLTLGKGKKTKEDVKLDWVEPGQEQVIFELSLDEVLQGTGERKGPWLWNWQRRPEPPRSPIHKYRKPGFVDQASFTVSLDLGGYTLTSEGAVLKVKSAEIQEKDK
jgi:hypothetical protein